jgi:hypothetical protein
MALCYWATVHRNWPGAAGQRKLLTKMGKWVMHVKVPITLRCASNTHQVQELHKPRQCIVIALVGIPWHA